MDPLPPVPLDQARERAVNALSVHFANDAITIEELERRIELAYRAKSPAELEALTADLDARPAAPPARRPTPPAKPSLATTLDAPDQDRLLVIMSETDRRGAWPVPRRLDVGIFMGQTRIDLTQSVLPSVVDIHVGSVMGAVRVIVPPGVHVVNHVSAVMGNVTVELGPAAAPIPADAPVVRLSGWTFLGEVKVTEA